LFSQNTPVKKTILIIENDGDTNDILASIVLDLGMHAICRKGVISISDLEKLNPAVILLDHWLDDGYGADYCMNIKTHPLTNHIPVVMLSAATGMRGIAAAAGADGFVAKPFDLKKLESEILKFSGPN
jgi:CheY-like chemotaxis protein